MRLFAVVLLLLSLPVAAQSVRSVQILLTDATQQPLIGATVQLVPQSDTTKRLYALTDTLGRAEVFLTQASYQLTATLVGMKVFRAVIQPTDEQSIFRFRLEADAKTLSTVTVTARKPLMRQEDDKTIVVAGNLTHSWFFIVSGWAFDVVVHTGLAFTIVFVLFPVFLFTGRYWLLFLSLLVTLLLFGALDRFSLWLWYYSDQPFRWFGVLASVAELGPRAGVLTAVLAGKHFYETQQRLVLVEKERTEAELRHLKAQIDPHFLFNNLNVLGSLIQRSPDQASAYLHRFSALYRYLIRHKDDDVVPLADELAFVTDYQYLIGQRFGRAFVFIEKIVVPDSLTVLVPPGSIQTLLENAVKHNQGDEQNPLLIELIIDEKTITVRNDIRPKLTPTDSTGTGLTNLRARYKFLSDQPVSIQHDAVEFVVTMPLLRGVQLPVNRLTT